MRGVIHESFGDPAKVLKLGERSVPEPASGQVRIRTIMSPIHNHDLWTVRGQYGYKPELPAVGGSEAVGIVDALGADVTNVKVGQRVSVAAVHGTWAEFFLAPAALLVPVPDSIDDSAAAQIIAMPLSALMLIHFLDVKSGAWIIQNAANGAVGKMVAVLAEAMGINVINLVRRDEGVDELAQVGVGKAISTASPDWKEKVQTLCASDPISAAIDSVGGEASGELLSLLGEGGALISFGSMSGEPMQLSSGDLIFKQAIVKGFWGSKVGAALSATDKAGMISEIFQAVQNGSLKLTVDQTYAFGEAAQAAAASLRSGRGGKIMLRP
ncbi:zinc-binding dehydrogenase [Oryzifoliimicrobium ureilyticus]|uniref:zinc-binding dehydrogenase n=1 Tax=Oryzifoliimicrobium ureilyticus TaxID=3113724 RepID=UPI00307676AE